MHSAVIFVMVVYGVTLLGLIGYLAFSLSIDVQLQKDSIRYHSDAHQSDIREIWHSLFNHGDRLAKLEKKRKR